MLHAKGSPNEVCYHRFAAKLLSLVANDDMRSFSRLTSRLVSHLIVFLPCGQFHG